MAYNTDPVVRKVAAVAQEGGDAVGVYIGLRPDGRIAYASWGRNRALCKAAGKLIDRLAEAVEDEMGCPRPAEPAGGSGTVLSGLPEPACVWQRVMEQITTVSVAVGDGL